MIEKLEEILPRKELPELEGIELFKYLVKCNNSPETGIAASSGCISCNSGGCNVSPGYHQKDYEE